MKTSLKWLLLSVTVAVCFFSCNSDEKSDILSAETQISEYALSDADAKQLILDFTEGIVTNGTVTRSAEPIEIGERKDTRNYTVSKEDGETENVQVYEYPLTKGEEEGYALVVGDSRIPAILAFVEYGSLADTLDIEPLNYYVKSIPQLLSEFLAKYSELDEEADETDETDGTLKTRARVQTYENERMQLRDSVDGPDIDCFTPTWGQDAPYNSSCPLVSTDCTLSASFGGRYPAGCVPIAIGEIIKYHIDKGTKPNIIQSQFSNNIGAFVADIGQQVDVSYGCSVSTAYIDDIRPAFSHYGYSSNSWQSYSSLAVSMSLYSGYPVYIVGGVNVNALLLHAWVIDGQAKGEGLYYHFHMNWGWNGTSNGYFNCGDWDDTPSSITGGGYNFLFSTFTILTNIH